MAPSNETTSPLPLTIARLVRRARNAKSPRDAHDNAWFALEVSLRLAVAAAPPEDPSALRRATVGIWCQSWRATGRSLRDERLLALGRLLSDLEPVAPPLRVSMTDRELVDAIAGYRNRVIGHGGARDARFFAPAAARLIAGIEAAWGEHLFLPDASRLIWVSSIAVDPQGVSRARCLDLRGETPTVTHPLGEIGTSGLLPGRIYLDLGNRRISLDPWFGYAEDSERMFCMNSIGNRVEYIDHASGETLGGPRLEEQFPGLDERAREFFGSTSPRVPEGSAPSADPTQFGPYRVLREIGRGGMGVVHLAEHVDLGRQVALKILPGVQARDPVSVARFRREIQALARADHQNVVTILSAGEAHGTLYYAMEYIDGVDLAHLAASLPGAETFEAAVAEAMGAPQTRGTAARQRTGRSPTANAHGARAIAAIFRDAARAIAHLHERGILHRDLKPANLMMTRADGRPVVMDLGLAALADASGTLSAERSRVVGTMRYLPPEQLLRNRTAVDRRADIYSLGATFYELLANRPFFDGDSEARLVEMVLHESPMPLNRAAPRVPRDLAVIVEKSCEKDPNLRYDTASALADDLDAFLDGRPISARPPSIAYVARLALRRHRALVAVAGVALLILLAATAWFIMVLKRERDDSLALLDHARCRALVDVERAWRSGTPFDPTHPAEIRSWVAAVEALGARLGTYHEMQARLTSERAGPRHALDRVDAHTAGEIIDMIGALRARWPATADALAQIEAAPERWQATRAELRADISALRWTGPIPEPDLALVPLGRDPESGLFEFADPRTGVIPKRDAARRLIWGPENALVLVLLPEGGAMEGASRASSAVSARIDAMFFSKFEMTSSQWVRIAASGATVAAASGQALDSLRTGMPVENVSGDLAESVVNGLGYRLPTPAEWTWAARAGTTTIWWTGDDEASLLPAENVSYGSLQVAGAGRPNPFGLYDMIGNAHEWSTRPIVDGQLASSPMDHVALRSCMGDSCGHDPTHRVARPDRVQHRPSAVGAWGVGIRVCRSVRTSP